MCCLLWMSCLPTVAQTPPSIPLPQIAPSRSDVPYTLGTGDRLNMEIFDVPEYSGEYSVLIDGTLNLPILGSVEVGGLTLDEATALISRRYAPYIVEPLVTLSLLSARPINLAVSGEVNRPGTYTVVLNQGRTFPTVTEALELARGITRAADLQQVQVRRTYQGREQNFTVNLVALLQNGAIGQNLTLRDGDTVFVPTTVAINPAEIRAVAESSFAPAENDPFPVAVVGEVVRPGTHIMGVTRSGNPPTVTQAIQQAGGIEPLADIRRIELSRLTQDGLEQTLEVNLWELLTTGDLTEDVILQRGDTIFIPEAEELNPAEADILASATFSPDVIKVNVVGEVVVPGTKDLPPNVPLNQALLAAGGFNNRADRGDVQLVRLNPDGTVAREEFRIDFTRDISDENNPILRNNDVVIVGKTGLASFSDTLGQVLEPIGRGFSLFTFPFNFLRIFGLE
ncbi:MAG: polysaccharide biosynthesis/export family protein [Cyanobacteriota bacterium]|nr:polysaccharide biosynthesis/export family protein [Cyanobacteriota bacterium]